MGTVDVSAHNSCTSSVHHVRTMAALFNRVLPVSGLRVAAARVMFSRVGSFSLSRGSVYLRRLCVVWMAWGWLLIMVMCQCPWCSSVWWRAQMRAKFD